MYATLPSAQLPDRVLFLSRSEAFVRMDAKSLRGLGISGITHTADREQAIAVLEKSLQPQPAVGNTKADQVGPFDLVICEEQLDSAPASVFLYDLARHRSLRGFPVLVLASNAKAARLLRIVGVTVLERPYTPDQLAEKLIKAVSPNRLPLQPRLFEQASGQGLALAAKPRAPRPAPAPKNSAPLMNSDLYQVGIGHLKKQDYEAARDIFTRLLERQEDHLEACLGLARAYQAQKNLTEVRKALLRAAAICLRKGDRIRAGHIATMLPPHMRNNIFACEALVRMQDGQFRAAALSFIEAANAQSHTPLHRLVARACLMTSSPEDCMRKVCDAMEGIGHILTARALRARLLCYPEFIGGGNSHTWLDRYPRLKEAVSVASYTAWAWKQA